MSRHHTYSYAPRRPRAAAAPRWLVVGLAALGLAAAGETAGRPEASQAASVRLVEASAGRVVVRVIVAAPAIAPSPALEGAVRVRLPGFAAEGPPGTPAVPGRRVFVGLPPEGAYAVTFRVLSSEPLGTLRLEPVPFVEPIDDDALGVLPGVRYEILPEAYAAFEAPPLVEALEPGWIRRQRVLPVEVKPLVYDGATGEAVLATEIEIVVSTGRTRFGDDAGRPWPESALWEGIYDRLLVNAAQARAWRVAPPRPARAPGAAPAALAQGASVRMRVRETGIHAATAATLVSAGFPAGEPLGSLHLFQRTYDEGARTAGLVDVGYHVIEGPTGTPGVFDGTDRLVFYARRLRDDPRAGDAIEKFADHNVYWLGTTGGPAMADRALAPGFVSADTATASFPVDERFEEDRVFWEEIRYPANGDFYTFNAGWEPGPVDAPFTVGRVAGATVQLTAELHGQAYISPRTVKLSVTGAPGTTVLDAAYSLPQKNRQEFTANIPAAALAPGAHALRLERPDGTRPSLQAVVNWVRLVYQARYRARGDMLRFNSGSLAGDTSLAVTGLSSPNLWLFDVTDPDAPELIVLSPAHFTPDAGGGSTLSFRDSFTAQRRYVLLPEARMIPVAASDVTLDTPSALVGSPEEGGVDVLVVAHASFVSQMQGWATYRRAQGHRVLLADVQDVYDEFNNGVPGTRGVDRFVGHFYALGGAGVLLLVGDASEDAKTVHAESGPNFVPTHSWPDHVFSLSLDEIVTTDRRYVKRDGPSDAFPDLVVGRLPVGSASELAIVLQKTYAFEKPSASDFWRRRIVIFSDDRYSEGRSSFGGAQFCPQPAERGFETSQESTAQTIENSLPAGYNVVRFHLSQYTEPFYGGACKSVTAAIQYGRANVTPRLVRFRSDSPPGVLDQGASLVTIQAHMNRSLVTHERVFSTQSAARLGGSTGRDHLRIDNRGKPFVIFGMGCHFSDYALHKELDPQRNDENSPNGDAFAEQLLLQNNKGAVATYGSTGFEYLNQVNAYMERVIDVWFYAPPYEGMIDQTQGQWIFGQLMYLVENEMAGGQSAPVERYHLLGDPLLRIDAGPPAFDVTVDGLLFTTGGLIKSGADGDTIQVVAIVTDENAIQDFSLEIAGADSSGQLTATPLVDQQLPRARQYRVTFSHVPRPETYAIVLRAFQAPDTTQGSYHMAAEFTLNVVTSVALSVNGRTVQSGEAVPAKGSYRVTVALPVYVPETQISVAIDDDVVTGASYTHPSAEDSTTWFIDFSRELAPGTHQMKVTVAGTEFLFDLVVSTTAGLRDVLAVPNPFVEATRFIYTSDVEISEGAIEIFTTSGKRIRRLDIPPGARSPGRNNVFWDGRDAAGGEVANGTYLFVVRVTQRDQSATVRGKLSRLR